MMKQFDIREFVKAAGGEDQVIITAEMPYKGVAVPGMGLCLTDSETKPQMCMIHRDNRRNKDLYTLDGTYKLEIISLETGFTSKYYQSGFNTMVNEGQIKVEMKPAFFKPEDVNPDISQIIDLNLEKA